MKSLIIVKLFLIASTPNIAEGFGRSRKPVYPEDLKRNSFWTNIVAGHLAVPRQFPWQVSIISTNAEGQRNVCGGSIITNRNVLTAAHCVWGKKTFVLGFGSLNLKAETRVECSIKSATIHPDYIPSQLLNDIAIFEMPNKIKLDDFIQIIRLPKRLQIGDTFTGAKTILSGWGMTYAGGPVSPKLRFTNLVVITNDECKRAFQNLIHPTNVCTSGPRGSEMSGACQGDSGGPLVMPEIDGLSTQIGVVSFVAKAGCDMGLPSAYARVSLYLDWISRTSGLIIRP